MAPYGLHEPQEASLRSRRAVRHLRRFRPLLDRRASRFSVGAVGRALGVHPRTVTRWEIGESLPKERQWSRALAFYATHVPELTHTVAAALGRVVPQSAAASADPAIAIRVVADTADALDLSPKHVRAVLLSAARAATEAGLSFEALLRATEEEAERLARRLAVTP